jgi:nucleotide-binding universal stress UspA family protein
MEKVMIEQKSQFNRNILIAVDDSENSQRAVRYVGQMLTRIPSCKITLLHVIPKPDEDFFSNPSDQNRWLSRYREKMTTRLETYRRELIDYDFSTDDVSVRIKQRFCPSMAECILMEREKLLCDTIVVGRQGLSRREEFLFGSISSKIVTHARNCTVWVVE